MGRRGRGGGGKEGEKRREKKGEVFYCYLFVSLQIPVVRNCGDDDVCISDLVLNISNVIYT